MTIISLEGASAVGKSTVCRTLEAEFGFVIVPEVNALYSRSTDEPKSWYFDRQVDRWKMACMVSSGGGLAVLDGDPFQPLWYNWIFSDLGFQPISEVISFYRKTLSAGIIRFPDRYYLLTTSELELRRRKQSDRKRLRRNFDRHISMIDPQFRYFESLNEGSPGIVSVVESTNVREVAHLIASDARSLQRQGDDYLIFEQMCELVRGVQN